MHRTFTEYFADDREDVIHTRDVTWPEVRQARDAALAASDWTAVKDRTMSQAWKDYRTALRDLPQDFPDSANDAADNWPVMPDA